MKKMIVSALIILTIAPNTNVLAKTKSSSLSKLSSRYIVVMDWESGRVLFEKDSNMVVPMASTTKIMTAIVALENSNLTDIVTISKRASSIRGSTIGLKYGQKLTMEELLYGLMLKSGNDCAIAIAEHIAGSVGAFIDMMNSKAFDMGAFNTHFSTPHGLDANGHFTTALDLAIITKHALDNETFSRIVGARDVTLEGASGPRKFHNINKLLGNFEGADGVKTGYTGKAGRCLVSSASRNGRRVICVVLNSTNRWEDSKKLLEYGLDNFKDETIIHSSEYQQMVNVNGGERIAAAAGIDRDINIPLSSGESGNLTTKTEVYDEIVAPVHKGQQVGRLIVYSGEKEIYSVPLKASEDIDKSISKNLFDKFKKGFKEN